MAWLTGCRAWFGVRKRVEQRQAITLPRLLLNRAGDDRFSWNLLLAIQANV